jgi:hypothetical protein
MLRRRDMGDGLHAARLEFVSQHSDFAFVAVARRNVSDKAHHSGRNGTKHTLASS